MSDTNSFSTTRKYSSDFAEMAAFKKLVLS